MTRMMFSGIARSALAAVTAGALLSIGMAPDRAARADAEAPQASSAAIQARLDKETAQLGREVMRRAIDWLKAMQDSETGAWGLAPDPKAPKFPAITGLVINGMLLDPRVTRDDPAVAKGVAFILSQQQPDGGIYDRQLQSYNTAICISALSRVGTDEAKTAMEKALKFLRTLQWGEEAPAAADGGESARVTRDNPFYGGVGYGSGGRPDNSNLNFFMQALEDAGVDCNDPAVGRALVFLSRTQMLGEVNDQEYAKGSKQGGFIYATATNQQTAGQGESKAEMIEETLDDGAIVSRLRAYGSMTYAGFKSYVYAKLPKDDIRVKAAYDWIRRNYTLDENPGAGTQGQYYYYVTFARALDALGEPAVHTLTADGRPGETRAWAADLIRKLAAMQNEDGSFRSVNSRWMENNPVLITAYAVIAIGHALD